MKAEIDKYLDEIKAFKAETMQDVENFRLRFLSRKGLVKSLAESLKEVPVAEKKVFGQALNQLKQAAQVKLSSLEEQLKEHGKKASANIDFTLPVNVESGTRHPLSIVRDEVISIFSKIGFSVAAGKEIEDDWHNFTALNFPPEHPAREMQDTFFITADKEMALRTHTSSVQVRVMESQKPPFRVIAPGRVYRNEAISARAHCFFHQIEGFYVEKGASFIDLKKTLDYFAKSFFGSAVRVRFRPSYFPFTEPSAELDISCTICNGKGCAICKHTGWLEILGCGMIDPRVLRNVHIDPEQYSGFAFGMGVERIAQLKFRVDDLRLYSENDVRFLRQFKACI